MKLPARATAPLFVLFASIAFATSGPLSRAARPEHPLAIAFGRVLIAGAVLFLLAPRRIVRALVSAPRRVRGTVALGGALLGAHFACFMWGIDSTSLPAAIALVSLEPLSVVVAAWMLHGDRPTSREALGVLVATLGAFVVARGAGTGEHRLLGDGLVVIAVVLYGTYVAVVRNTRGAFEARDAAALVYLVAAASILPALLVAPARENGVVWPVPPHALVAILALAFVPTLLGHTAVQTASRSLPPSIVAMVSPGETLGGIAIAAFMGAKPTNVELAGAVVIVIGASVAIVGASREGSS